jgi:hypothetical protein
MLDIFVAKIQPIIRPREIIIRGMVFISKGRTNIEFLEIRDNHEIALPAVTDITDRRVIGIMIALYS